MLKIIIKLILSVVFHSVMVFGIMLFIFFVHFLKKGYRFDFFVYTIIVSIVIVLSMYMFFWLTKK